MSARQVRNCLEALRTMLAWAVRADVRKLPAEFVNPLTRDVVGPKPQKDPLRKAKLPLEQRIKLIHEMDQWELLHLSILMILPLRFEDLAGALVSDVDFANRTFHFGSRFGDSDFNKGRLNIEMPLPQQLLPVLRACTAGRPEGSLFRSRAVWEGRVKPQLMVDSCRDLENCFHRELDAAPAGKVQTQQDRKRVFRELLRRLGGISEKHVGKVLKSLLIRAGLGERTRPYDLRGSITTEMKTAGIRHLELRYLTLHSVNDILCEYTGLDPAGEMEKYFRRCQPLLQAVLDRASRLGIVME